jgi:hypothetical protein
MAKEKKYVTCDGNEAAAHIAYMFSEVAAQRVALRVLFMAHCKLELLLQHLLHRRVCC